MAKFQEYPKHVFNPRHGIDEPGDYAVVKDEAEYQKLLDRDEGWRDAPYTDEERGEYARTQGTPQRKDFKTKKEFEAALAEYRAAQESNDKDGE